MDGIARFLRTDPDDAGCAQTMDLLHVYVDETLADAEPELRHPGVAAHLRACPPCEVDRQGLLAAVSER
jgi:hypothetical protein